MNLGEFFDFNFLLNEIEWPLLLFFAVLGFAIFYMQTRRKWE